MSEAPFLQVSGLRSGYEGSTVLHGVDLTVPEGSVVALLGRNGVGKSTLISTIMGLVKPYAGSVLLEGTDVAGHRVDAIARAGVGLVPQGRRMFAPLTVAEHLRLAEDQGRRITGRRAAGSAGAERPWTLARVLDLLPRLGERQRNRGDQLSGGEQQMLAIARALLTNPRLLLLDEPSDGLAPSVVRQVGEVVQDLLTEGLSILLVEQDLRLAFSVADRVAVMDKGRIVLDTTVTDFRSDAARARALLGVG
ncbi:ABC transporter ATP-binding protein [Ornithinicoccus hortensis]|uniref:Amino acid/amide ABC transporter ATP-binding protein 2 (HAAT family) n=1 Tax=Ornithinicoccus hortensis TaxID=82346 RepID=A0A542YUG8_9MICO|nr:ABC transporter ATP-binding protein [Ornithinicoccus hortensis]TQL51604.1 amino acid/amide ABC transporter ATP-binding protein 2 (HAAT family) [Ornithinicoccus hortensis]